MSKTLVLYNGTNPFGELTPFISKSDEFVNFHNRWCAKSTINLQGKVSGLCFDFSSLINNQRSLMSAFSQDFKELTIQEEGQTIYTAPYCTVRSINFSDSKYVRLIDYNITLDCYQQNLFSGNYGVLDPVNRVSYEESEDSIITATRTISAKGFNTNSNNNANNSFDNARQWVQGLTGWNTSNFSLPYFITYNSGLIAPCLREQSENIDRFNATYEITETYSWNKFASSSTIIKYSTSHNYSEEDGFYTVDIEGTIEACPEDNIDNVRQLYKSLDLYSIANYEFHKCFPSAPNLNPEYLSDQVSENTQKRVLTFSRSYDTDLRAPVMFDYEISVSYDVLLDIHRISINGVIRSRNSQKVRWLRVLEYYENLNIFNLINSFYISNGYPYNLVKYPLSYNVTENEFAGEITIQCSWDNRKPPEPEFDDFKYTVSIEPSINQYLPIPVICGNYTILDLNSLKRAKITVNGEAFSLVNVDKSEAVRIIARKILNEYIEAPASNRVLKIDQISTAIEAQGRSYDFSREETYSGPEFSV